VKSWLFAMLLCLAGLTAPAAVIAQPLESTQIEINYLLDYLEISGCRFYRNGNWYDSTRAQEHLRDKYEYLLARDRIDTTEDFIEKAASRSSMSGRAYEVQCGTDCTTASTSGDWLTGVLARYRAVIARGGH